LTALEADLCRINSNDPTFASTILDAYTQHPRLKQQSAYRRLDVIDRCFSRRTVEEIISALEREATQEADGWISATIQALKKGSPASLKISLRSVSSQNVHHRQC
jgi:3-hydroxyisobutyryl-CoA hydrolase